jgi:hypothetical protein
MKWTKIVNMHLAYSPYMIESSAPDSDMGCAKAQGDSRKLLGRMVSC